jgi:hypothetical protein
MSRSRDLRSRSQALQVTLEPLPIEFYCWEWRAYQSLITTFSFPLCTQRRAISSPNGIQARVGVNKAWDHVFFKIILNDQKIWAWDPITNHYRQFQHLFNKNRPPCYAVEGDSLLFRQPLPAPMQVNIFTGMRICSAWTTRFFCVWTGSAIASFPPRSSGYRGARSATRLPAPSAGRRPVRRTTRPGSTPGRKEPSGSSDRA